MRGIIIVNGYSNISRYEAERLREEFAPLGIAADIIENTIGAYMPQADFAVFLDKDVRLARDLEGRGYRLFNTAGAIEICDDKALTYTALRGSGIAFPDTIYAPLCYSDLSELQEKVTEEVNMVTQKLGLPLVFKLNQSSLGAGVMLVKSADELRLKMVEYASTPHHYQRYIRTARGSDVRIIVIGGKAVAAMLRSNESDFRSNVAAGGRTDKCNPAAEYIEVAERAAEVIQLDYCGVDILEGEGGMPLLLEVNSNAFFRGMEKVSGVNVARAYAEYISAVL